MSVFKNLACSMDKPPTGKYELTYSSKKASRTFQQLLYAWHDCRWVWVTIVEDGSWGIGAMVQSPQFVRGLDRLYIKSSPQDIYGDLLGIDASCFFGISITSVRLLRPGIVQNRLEICRILLWNDIQRSLVVRTRHLARYDFCMYGHLAASRTKSLRCDLG